MSRRLSLHILLLSLIAVALITSGCAPENTAQTTPEVAADSVVQDEVRIPVTSVLYTSDLLGISFAYSKEYVLIDRNYSIELVQNSSQNASVPPSRITISSQVLGNLPIDSFIALLVNSSKAANMTIDKSESLQLRKHTAFHLLATEPYTFKSADLSDEYLIKDQYIIQVDGRVLLITYRSTSFDFDASDIASILDTLRFI